MLMMRIRTSSLVYLKQWLTPGKLLSQQVVLGGIWVFALRITDRLFALVRTIVLARLLAPTDFGLFGIALLALSSLEAFSQTGFNKALIQKKGDTTGYLDTAWTVQVTRGAMLAATLFILSPLVASFFKAPEAKPILQVIALSILLQGFTNIGVIFFQKNLEFHRQFAYMFSGTFVNLIVAISATFLLRSVWALVLGHLAGSFLQMAVSYSIHPYRPRLRLDRQKLSELYLFGRWVLGSSILGFLAVQADDIFVGKFVGITALGMYQMAFRLSNLAATEITGVISQVTFPAYSKLQSDIPKLREAFLKTFEATSMAVLPITAAVLLLAPDFTRIFLGEKWMPMVPALQLLSVSGFILSLLAACGPLVLSVGQPEVGFWVNIIRVGVMAVLIYPLTLNFGIVGTAGAALAGIGACIATTIKASFKVTGISAFDLWEKFYPSFLGTVVISFLAFFMMRPFSPAGGSIFFVEVAFIATGYLGLCYGIWKIFKIGPVDSLKFIINQLKLREKERIV